MLGASTMPWLADAIERMLWRIQGDEDSCTRCELLYYVWSHVFLELAFVVTMVFVTGLLAVTLSTVAARMFPNIRYAWRLGVLVFMLFVAPGAVLTGSFFLLLWTADTVWPPTIVFVVALLLGSCFLRPTLTKRRLAGAIEELETDVTPTATPQPSFSTPTPEADHGSIFHMPSDVSVWIGAKSLWRREEAALGASSEALAKPTPGRGGSVLSPYGVTHLVLNANACRARVGKLDAFVDEPDRCGGAKGPALLQRSFCSGGFASGAQGLFEVVYWNAIYIVLRVGASRGPASKQLDLQQLTGTLAARGLAQAAVRWQGGLQVAEKQRLRAQELAPSDPVVVLAAATAKGRSGFHEMAHAADLAAGAPLAQRAPSVAADPAALFQVYLSFKGLLNQGGSQEVKRLANLAKALLPHLEATDNSFDLCDIAGWLKDWGQTSLARKLWRRASRDRFDACVREDWENLSTLALYLLLSCGGRTLVRVESGRSGAGNRHVLCLHGQYDDELLGDETEDVEKQKALPFPSSHYKALKILSSYGTITSMRMVFNPLINTLACPMLAGFFLGTRGLLFLLSGSNVLILCFSTFLMNAGQSWFSARRFILYGLLKDSEGKSIGPDSLQFQYLAVGEMIGGPFEESRSF
eukprot:s40_g13.t1